MWDRVYDLKLHRWLHRVRMPTLLLWGEADRLIPVEQAAVWADLLPDAEVRRLPVVGHLIFEEHGGACGLVADFVASTSVAGTA